VKFAAVTGIACAACVIGCWAPRRPESADLYRSRVCTHDSVAVLHNVTERETRIFVTDVVRRTASMAGGRQLPQDNPTTDYAVLPAGATDTMFDVSGQKYAWAPGAQFACVPLHNDER
jgi:hypothetical protein